MVDKRTEVEILFFDECPSWHNAQEILQSVLDGLGISVIVALTQVETQEEAVINKFVGSPTIRVNGEDIFPTGQDHYALGCRVYQTPDGFRGWPTEEMLKEKLEPVLANN